MAPSSVLVRVHIITLFILKKLILLLFLFPFISYAQKATLSGYVRDQANGEELIGVSIIIDSLSAGAITNVYGFYSLTLNQGTHKIRYSYLGYEILFKTVDLADNISLNIDLPQKSTQIEEITITDRAIDENITDVGMSKNTLKISQIKKLPALFGEPDIIKTIQMLPGVVSAGEGTSSYFVRGGSADQNLILIDEAPIYDPSHLFGLFSVFNSDVLKDSELYKGGIPSRYGGRLSSILDVRTRDGNNNEIEGGAGIGTLASKLTLEGPIVKDKSSFIVSGRRSYVDAFLKAAGEENLVHFYDLNAKVNYRQNNNNRYFISAYMGRDVFRFGDFFNFGWGNKTATFRWNHLFNEKFFSNTSLIASNFDYKLGLSFDPASLDWDSALREYTFKQDMTYFFNPRNTMDFGYQGTYRKFQPGKITPTDTESIFTELVLDPLYAIDHALYASMNSEFGKLTLDYGIRFSYFQNVGESTVYLYEDEQNNIQIQRSGKLDFERWENVKVYPNIEPRFAARYMLSSKSSVKGSYNRMVQNTHLIASGTVPLPFNTWYPSSFYLEPQIADQLAVGYFRNFMDNQLEFSLESYYKDMNNVTDFADNAQLFFNEDLPTEFRQGRSWSYGLESMIKKDMGDLTGFISYTWSKVYREIDGVNGGLMYPANHDKRHSFNFVTTYDLSEKWIFGMTFNFSTGRPITLPAGRYELEGVLQPDLFTYRNAYRLPNYHRMDLSATLNPQNKKNRKIQGQWIFSIYNVYNRKNPFTIYTRVAEDEDGNIIGDGTQKEARMIYLFPILPSVTYNINF